MADKSQSEKKYGNDWAKSKSRELVRDTISKTLLKFRKPKDLRVLCFPGIDATEVFEVYDSLGIPRENVVGVERDSYVAGELEKKDLGIKVINQDLESLVENGEVPTDLDIVSLDYTSPLRQGNLDTLRSILRMQTKNHLLLHHSNLMKRDKASYGLYVYGHSLNTKHINLNINEINERIVSGVSTLLDGGSVEEKKDVRIQAYPVLLKAAINNLDVGASDEIFKFSSKVYPQILSKLEKEIKRMYGKEVNLEPSSPLQNLSMSEFFQGSVVRLFEETVLTNLRIDLEKMGGREWGELDISLMACLFDTARKHRFYRIRDAFTYTYISESGAPMIGDIYFLSHPEKVIEASKEVARAVGYPNKFRHDNKDEIMKTLIAVRKASRRFYSDRNPEEVSTAIENRTFLGSSARPVLTKQKAIEEFKSGSSVEDVREKYRGVNGKPLAQWKAHVTMGTYGEKPIRVEDEIVEHTEDSDLEKITKEEAIELIESGIPLEEIESAYPTSFSKGQLRAYKAHLTMGTYEK